jgi:hypothetical protein
LFLTKNPTDFSHSPAWCFCKTPTSNKGWGFVSLQMVTEARAVTQNKRDFGKYIHILKCEWPLAQRCYCQELTLESPQKNVKVDEEGCPWQPALLYNKQPKRPSTETWLNKQWHILTPFKKI